MRLSHGCLATLAVVTVAVTGLSAQERPLAMRTIPLDQLCGAEAALVAPAATVRISRGAERMKTLFGPGDAVIVSAGSAQGIRAGQRYVVRRVIDDRFAHRSAGARTLSIHTAGWITILETQADVSVAAVSEACDGVTEGDYLEPMPTATPASIGGMVGGDADYARPAHIILGDERRQMGSAGDLLVMDRGTDHGLRTGQKLTIFRETMNGKGPVVTVGEAVIVTTHPETSLFRILASREAVYVGDLIAIHR
ncbi:MAG TPA: hypothetical protein VNJ03_08265 [Vicinamibacterales bacterium]|nr:hypothetical protein [Vicinamibacterales bacterium]